MLWGLLHILGGGVILAALGDSPEAGFAVYQQSGGTYPPLAGTVLGYLAYGFAWTGLLVILVAAIGNWRNSAPSLALNTALVGFTDLGLVNFLLLPGYVGWAEASPGLVLFLLAVIAGGMACRVR
jgi:hypothetical protein